MSVYNQSEDWVQVKDEGSSDTCYVPPGGSYHGEQDGFSIEGRDGVFKTVDGMDAVITDEGIETYVSQSDPHAAGISTAGQWLIGGWLDEIPDDGWKGLLTWDPVSKREICGSE